MARVVAVLAVLRCTWAQPSARDTAEYFEPQCQSENDHGWPRFNSSKELESSAWATYFKLVYGELPSKYPLCIYDFWFLDTKAYTQANITGPAVKTGSDLKEGDLYLSGANLGIYHGKWAPLPDNAWVEIAHVAFPTEVKGYWVWRTRGTGVWYNIGKTKVFPQPADPMQTHRAAIEFLKANCSVAISPLWPLQEQEIFGLCAREKGYNSIQFEPQEGQVPLGSFGFTGLTEIVLVDIDGKYNCGVPDQTKTPLREGWAASRQCECTNFETDDSCGLMPRAPFPLWIMGSSPICKLQEGPWFWDRFKKCNPNTCKATTCARRSAAPAGDASSAIVV